MLFTKVRADKSIDADLEIIVKFEKRPAVDQPNRLDAFFFAALVGEKFDIFALLVFEESQPYNAIRYRSFGVLMREKWPAFRCVIWGGFFFVWGPCIRWYHSVLHFCSIV